MLRQPAYLRNTPENLTGTYDLQRCQDAARRVQLAATKLAAAEHTAAGAPVTSPPARVHAAALAAYREAWSLYVATLRAEQAIPAPAVTMLAAGGSAW